MYCLQVEEESYSPGGHVRSFEGQGKPPAYNGFPPSQFPIAKPPEKPFMSNMKQLRAGLTDQQILQKNKLREELVSDLDEQVPMFTFNIFCAGYSHITFDFMTCSRACVDTMCVDLPLRCVGKIHQQQDDASVTSLSGVCCFWVIVRLSDQFYCWSAAQLYVWYKSIVNPLNSQVFFFWCRRFGILAVQMDTYAF